MESDNLETIRYEVKPFTELTPKEFYACFKLRYDVFVVEQQCIYDEFDNHDLEAAFVIAKSEDSIVGLARIATIEGKLHIGRVVVAPAFRKRGIARKLMHLAIEKAQANHHGNIFVSAQEYLKGFYQSINFQQIGEPYDWDGIIHVDMYLCAE